MKAHHAEQLASVGTLEVLGLVVGPLQENCYLIVDRERSVAVVVDPGDDAPSILSALSEEQVSLAAIWLTHAHVDHVGAVSDLLAAHAVPVYLHPADLPLYERAAQTGRLYGMHFEQPPNPDRELAEGTVMTVGRFDFGVIHVPGHSPGQVAFVGHGLCLSGDLLFAGSIGRTDLPLSDPRAMVASLVRVTELADDTVVFPGHGELTTIGRERAANPFLRGLARPLGS